MASRPCLAVVLTVCLGGFAHPATGQAAASLGLGAALIEYDGFLASGAAVVSPAFRFDASQFSLGARGSWTVFESGNRVLQGNLAAGWLSGGAGPLRFEASGSAGATSYASEARAGHLLGTARVHLAGSRAGAWLGAVAGRTFGDRDESPLEVSVAGWSVRQRVALVGTATASWVGNSRYVDLLGAVRWTGSGVELEGRLGIRPWSRHRGTAGDPIAGGFADATARISLTERLSLSLSGGTYPSDPVRRVLGARYLNAGLQIETSGRGAVRRASLVGAISPEPSEAGAAGPTFEVVQNGGTRIRVLARGVRSVEVMADFSDWEPVVLAEVSPGVWEAAWPVAAGAHRVNVRIDGGGWMAPLGLRAERTEFGGIVGVVIVP